MIRPAAVFLSVIAPCIVYGAQDSPPASAVMPAFPSFYDPAPPRFPTLADLKGWAAKAPKGDDEDEPKLDIRDQALRETAFSIGSQTSFGIRAYQYNRRLKMFDEFLSDVFRFDLLLLDNGRVLPPVITEAQDTITITDKTMRVASKYYEIGEQARFTSLAPSWRQYLLFPGYSPPTKPPGALLPHNARERRLWKGAVAEGWEAGFEQASRTMAVKVAKLRRAFVGRVRYHLLHLHGYVSAPYVAVAERGVAGGGSSLTIGETVLRITALPQMNPNPDSWKPIPQLPTAFSSD